MVSHHPQTGYSARRERSVKCILRWALGWKVLFPPTWEPIHGQFETVGREGRVLAIGDWRLLSMLPAICQCGLFVNVKLFPRLRFISGSVR
jgi:hypothetical protein